MPTSATRHKVTIIAVSLNQREESIDIFIGHKDFDGSEFLMTGICFYELIRKIPLN